MILNHATGVRLPVAVWDKQKWAYYFNMITIRSERQEDFSAIYEINKQVFKGEIEPRLVEKIRRSNNFIPELSLVALKDDKIVGHILFSKVKLICEKEEKEILTLAPLAVLPEFQKQGIGSFLVKEGLKICRNLNHNIVIVVGRPDYYPRFGFIQARTKGLDISFKIPVPDEAFMVYELEKGFLDKIKGVVKLPSYFEEE